MDVSVPTAGKVAVDGRWRTLAILSGAIVLSMTTWFSATAIVPELMSVWNLSDSAAAWLTNAVQIGFVVGALGASLFNIPDILSARALMAGAATLAAVANAMLLFVSTPETAIALRFVTGVALAGVYPPALKLVSTWFTSGRGFALGCVIGALTLGSAFPHLLRAFSGGLDWRVVVFSTSLMTLGGAFLMWCYAHEGPFSFSRAAFDPRQIGRVLRSRPVALANIGYFGHMWELYAMWGWFLAFAQAALGTWDSYDAATASLLTFGVVASGIAGSILGGYLADRIGRTATTALMMTVSGSCAVLIGFAFDGPSWLFILLAAIWGISVIGDSAQFSAIVTEVGDQAFVGTALALQLGLGFALTVISIGLVPMAAEWLGSWQWAFLILAPGPLIGTLAMLALRRAPESIRIAQGRR
ncbi:MFS transporter [Microvirga massiliensis]|uniref:MFS transporter n=1 Tax=Microvirga massiliensis TaxID=1033741 RepID=UPI00062B92E5|nr:MFS transporter [Microvirga massiliensis]